MGWKFPRNENRFPSHPIPIRVAMGMGIPMGIPMGMGMGIDGNRNFIRGNSHSHMVTVLAKTKLSIAVLMRLVWSAQLLRAI